MSLLPKSASTLIIGGGIQGLSLAFNLAEMGQKGIVVLDAGYWQGGASGRNGTLIRAGFSSTAWSELFKLTLDEWQTWSKRLGENVMFTRRGYTVVAEKASTVAMLEEGAKLHARLGIRSQILDKAKTAKLLPALNQQYVLAAQHQPDGGVAPHHAAMKALHHYCHTHGVGIHYRTKVTGIETTNGRASAVMIGDHRIEADNIVCCAGGHNPEMAGLAGVTLNGHGMKIEAMALEPTRPLIKPAIALIDSLAYFHQTSRGEVVGGTEVPETPHISLRSDVPVMADMAKIYLRMFPQLGPVRILRHWGGLIHASKDFAPLLGPHPDLKDFWFSAGWSYGFAGAPAAGRLLAQAIGRGQTDARMKPFALDRFETTGPIVEGGIVVA